MKLSIDVKLIRYQCLLIFLLVFTTIRSVYGQNDSLTLSVLKQMSLEELMNIEVTSVSKRAEKLMTAASSIQVITREDIRRAGVTSIAEALRLADNIQIAQKNAHDWAITTRGFNTDLANKLLVLIDGRTVYTPLFSGVFWDRQDYLLEDIDRIEVISGPGGTLWGANAVNGVINIITKNSQHTQGLYVETGGGTELKHFSGVRYGGMLSPATSFRVYGKVFGRDNAVFSNGKDAGDAWQMGQAGFRMEVNSSLKNQYTFQGDYYNGEVGLSVGGETKVTGGNFLSRWTHTISDKSHTSLQVYFDRTYFAQPVPEAWNDDSTVLLAPAGVLKEGLNTYDVDFQYHFPLGDRHRLVWGTGYRRTYDSVQNAPALAFVPSVLRRNLFSSFLQDEIRVLKNLYLIIGSKVEHNDYTGFELEPNVRIQAQLTTDQTVWGAVSRAVRMPSRVDRDIRLPTPGFSPLVDNLLIGGANFKSETLIAYELGYRTQVNTKVSASIAGFYNCYNNIRSTSFSPAPALLGLPLFYENNLKGKTYGVELSINYQLFPWWRLHSGYNYLKENIRVKPDTADFNNALNETADPPNRFSFRSSMNLPKNVEIEIGLRWIDAFRYNDVGKPATVPNYVETEARLGWQPKKWIEISIVGQNLLRSRHQEYVISKPNPPEEIQRSFYGKIICRL